MVLVSNLFKENSFYVRKSNEVMSNSMLNKVRSTCERKKYIFRNQTYHYYDVDKKLWKELSNAILKNRFWLRRKLTGGFVYDKSVFIKKSRKIGRKKLILYE